jgi:putative hydrolase of the HAD superfamily
MPKTYQHLFFDLDHTLWDFDKNAVIALQEMFETEKLSERIQACFEDFLPHYLHHNKVLWDRYHKGFISTEELKWKRMYRALLEFKIGDENLAKHLGVRFLDILPVQKQVFPYTFEILDYLKGKGYQLHLITNGFEKTQHLKLDHSGLRPYFQHVITSESSNSVKPQKEIFFYAFNRTGAKTENSIMIGDNPDADIQGALNVEMDSVYVNHLNKESNLLSTYTVFHLKELAEIF